MTEWLSSRDNNGVSNLEKLQGLQDLSKILKWKHWFDHKDVNGTTGYDKINTLYKLESYDFRQNLEKLAQKEDQYDKQFQEKLDSLEGNFKDKFEALDEKFQEVEKLSAAYSKKLQEGYETAQKITDTFKENDTLLEEKEKAWDKFQDDCETKIEKFETDHSSILDKTRLDLEKLKEEIENIKKESFEVLN